MAKEKILKQNIEEVLEVNYMPYAVSTIEDRAIVGIDGMKPVHRRMLYSMYLDGLLKGDRVKSAKAVGNVLKFHPHGDSAVYETMVRLAQPDSVNIVLVDGKGNLGEHTSSELQPAHMRYTEVKLTPIVKEFFTDIEKMNSLMIKNFDGSALEPRLIPTKFPNVLANTSMGIAVGMGSKICGFNLKELCEATIKLIENNKIDIIDYMKAPDFPTGGEILYDSKIMKQIFETGEGGITVRAKIQENPSENTLLITEIPYTTTREAIVSKIIELVKEKKLTEIVDINDLTDLNGMKIEIEYKKNTDTELLKNKLYKLTTLEDTYSCNFNILIDGKPKVLGVKDILLHWLDFRKKCIIEATLFNKTKKEEELKILKGYSLIIKDIEKVIKILRFTPTEEEMIKLLNDEFGLTKTQSEHIINMKLKNINERYLNDKIKDLLKVTIEIEDLNNILTNDNNVFKIITEELTDIVNKYNTPRKSTILEDVENLTKEDLIQSYVVKICLTEQGYLKKIRTTGYRPNSTFTLKEGDKLITVVDGNNKGYMLLFSNKGNVFKKRVNDFEDVKMAQIGVYLNNILDMDSDEKIILIIATEKFEEDLFIAFKDGNIARIPLDSYNTTRTKLLNAYSMKSPIINMFTTTCDKILFKSDLNKVLILNTNTIPRKVTKNTIGVSCLKAKDNSSLAMCYPLSSIEGLINSDYYLSKNRNAIGKSLRKIDKIIVK